MKATFDIPDDLYRHVKARSAMEGRPLRSVAVELFQNWLSSGPVSAVPEAQGSADAHKPTRFDNTPWREIIRPYIKPGMSHDLDEMEEAIARGWGDEAAAKLDDSQG